MNKKNLVKIKVTDHGSEYVQPEFAGDYVRCGDIEFRMPWHINKVNIKTTDAPKDGCTVSWHYHDVFKKLAYVYIDLDSVESMNERFGPKMLLESSKLYSKTKLRKLARSKDFKEKRYSFFSYDFVGWLLGQKTKTFGMSGGF